MAFHQLLVIPVATNFLNTLILNLVQLLLSCFIPHGLLLWYSTLGSVHRQSKFLIEELSYTCMHFMNGNWGEPGQAPHCKVAGSNLTCRDDSKTRWRLHSVDLTSTGLSSLDQNIIHSPVARVVYG